MTIYIFLAGSGTIILMVVLQPAQWIIFFVPKYLRDGLEFPKPILKEDLGTLRMVFNYFS